MTDAPAAARRRAFRELHAAGCFVMPNPWDLGSEFLDAAREIADSGTFARLGGARPFAEVDGFFGTE